MPKIPNVFIGVDVSKEHLDIHLYPLKKDLRISNTDKAILKFIQLLMKYDVYQIVLEATGGYQQKLVKLCHKAGYKVWTVNPKIIRAFIISEEIKAKTDKIDAQMIALFASQKKKKYDNLTLPDTESIGLMKSLHRRRTDLVEMLKEEKTRLIHPSQSEQKKGIAKHIGFLEKEIKLIENRLQQIIVSRESLQKKHTILSSFPGVGKITAVTLLCEMPELGVATGKQVAAMVGVAPIIRQSGLNKGVATTQGGRDHVRQIIYMAALSARKHNPVLKDFYERLIYNGKRPKVALVALMRKLIVIIHVMLKKQEVWRYIGSGV